MSSSCDVRVGRTGTGANSVYSVTILIEGEENQLTARQLAEAHPLVLAPPITTADGVVLSVRTLDSFSSVDGTADAWNYTFGYRSFQHPQVQIDDEVLAPAGQVNISFDISVFNVKTFVSKDTSTWRVDGNNNVVPNLNQGSAPIIQNNDRFGIDVPVPTATYQHEFVYAAGALTAAKFDTLVSAVPTTNSNAQFGFNPGRMALFGVSGNVNQDGSGKLNFSWGVQKDEVFNLKLGLQGVNQAITKPAWWRLVPEAFVEDAQDPNDVKKLVTKFAIHRVLDASDHSQLF